MMSDSQYPKPAQAHFEVPDLEVEPVPRSLAKPSTTYQASEQSPPAHNSFDDDVFANGPNIELDDATAHSEAHVSSPRIDVEQSPPARTSAREALALDAAEVALIAAYGQTPKSAYSTPAYAFRIFMRQRELRAALDSLELQRERADTARNDALTALGQSVRAEVEKFPTFSRFLAPLVELEQVAAAHGHALSSVNAELRAQTATLDAELATSASQLLAEQEQESSAERARDDRDAAARRAEAKLKRVLIEIRSVTQVAEQKLGPQGGTIPEPEAAQLAALKQRADGVQPEVNQTKLELEQARANLEQATARVAAAQQRQRLALRKKQALAEHYRKELDLRSRGFGESEQKHRAALADLGRAALAAESSVPVTEASLELVRNASQQVDELSLRCELQRHALTSYDRPRAAQGVRLACTGLALFVFLVVLKLAL